MDSKFLTLRSKVCQRQTYKVSDSHDTIFMMKKIVACLLAVLLTVGMLTGCSSSETKPEDAKTTKKLRVVCTIFPEYDWVRQIVGEDNDSVELTMLLDNGVDLHSYQPSADDMIKISTCDVFVYVGGESDGWVKDALKEVTNKNMIAINLLDVLGDSVKEEEVVEGMEEESEEAHEHEEGEQGDAEEEPEYDEHVWLSLKHSNALCSYIGDKLGEADSQNASKYTENAKKYCQKIEELNSQYESVVAAAGKKTILFGDRFPFRYLADDYKLTYYAAFPGCSAETEASFKTITYLASKVDECRLGSVITIEGTQHKIAETIIKNTKEKNQKILSLNSMQSVTSEDVKAGTTYLSIMEKNLEVLKEALK